MSELGTSDSFMPDRSKVLSACATNVYQVLAGVKCGTPSAVVDIPTI